MNELIIKETNIKDMIYEIRDKQVILDSDLAKLYECKNGTKDINKAVKRNIERFPEDFYFQLTEKELNDSSLRFQIGTLNSAGNLRGKHIKYLPYAFTEQGVAMLAGILHTNKAIKTSIDIINAFVAMRHYIYDNQDILKSINNLNNKVLDHDDKLDYLFSKFDGKEKIYLAGQSYDAYSDLINIFNTSKQSIIIIDPYADKVLLDLIKNIKNEIILITKTNSLISNKLLTEYNKKYHNLTIIRNDTIHDRYVVIDNTTIYHLGASINHLGSKMFNINKFEDKFMTEIFFKELDKIISR